MSSFRLVPLLVFALAVAGCMLPASVQAGDPTTECATMPSGANPPYGNWLSDAGYYELWGLESYYSTDYAVLCSWRGYYGYDPNGNTNQWGPWHGNENDTNCDVHGSTYFSAAEYASSSIATVAVRTNAADGRNVITQFRIGTSCETTRICAGLCLFAGNADSYAKQQQELEQDPTYQEYTVSSPGPGVPVMTFINGTSLTTAVQSKDGSQTAQVSVCPDVQFCYGYVDNPCPTDTGNGSK